MSVGIRSLLLRTKTIFRLRTGIPVLVFLLAGACILHFPPLSAEDTQGDRIQWRSWSENLFKEAARENKLVLLNLEAVWCHWCHVMAKKTYRSEKVIDLLHASFIPVKVDQDSRPDLKAHYENYGWPATIVFNAKGQELVKQAGYIAPGEMAFLLEKVRKNPSPLEVSSLSKKEIFGDNPLLSQELRAQLLAKHYSSFDPESGGLKIGQKFLDADSIEFSLLRAFHGSERDRLMAKQTLDSNLKLFDPVWGGVYQYSTHGTWDRPHYEKIMFTQSKNMEIYAGASLLFQQPEYLKASLHIRDYIRNFLTAPEGAFYTSQDADVVRGEHSAQYFALSDEGRRKVGIPAIDKHIYARENGWMIASLLALYTASSDDRVLQDVLRATKWIAGHRVLPEGGFRHDENDVGGPYLADSLSMGVALLRLYITTAERSWLEQAEAALQFIGNNFSSQKPGETGFYSSKPLAGSLLQPVRQIDDNITLARFANLIYHYTGKKQYREFAEQAMKYLATPAVALDRATEAGILLADRELSLPPLHITVVSPKDKAEGKSLFRAALKVPVTYKRLEWFDVLEGPLPNQDVEYPVLDRAALFICTNKRCSLPIFEPGEVGKKVGELEKK